MTKTETTTTLTDRELCDRELSLCHSLVTVTVLRSDPVREAEVMADLKAVRAEMARRNAVDVARRSGEAT